MIIYPYKPGSSGAKALADELQCNLMKEVGSRYNGAFIINWGNSEFPKQWTRTNQIHPLFLNMPEHVAKAINKLETFKALGDVPHVPWTTEKETAQTWLSEGHKVVVRKAASASGGKGIEVVTGGVLPDAPLFTLYVKKKKEYRVHCTPDEIIDVQEKRKRTGADADPLIRSHSNGWVFCRENVNCPEEGLNIAKQAVNALNLDFGAVDLLHNEHYNRFYVCEVNSAPGIEGTTIKLYGDFFRRLQQSYQ